MAISNMFPNMGDGSPSNPYKWGAWGSATNPYQNPFQSSTTRSGSSSGYSSVPQNQYSAHDEAQNRSDIDASTAAMKITQARAMADRESAFGEIRGGRDSALAEYNNLGEGPMTQKIIDATYNQGRETAESERQSMLRQIQRSYYGGGGAPSGAALKAAQGVDLAKMGTLANLRRQINTDAATTNYSARETQAQGRAGIYSNAAENMASIYGNTIAGVPDYKTIAYNQGNTSNNQGVNMSKYGAHNNFGREGEQMNVDFLAANPEGFNAWKQAGMPDYRNRTIGNSSISRRI